MRSRILLVFVLVLVCTRHASGLHFYVDGNPGGNGDDRRSVQSAQDRTTPFRTIGHALRIAHLERRGRPHLISVAAGTYSTAANGEQFPLTVTQSGIYLESLGRVVFDAEGRSGFFSITGRTSDFLVSGIEFINGRASRGGAIYCDGCSLRVANNRFTGLQATDGGHVLYARNGRVRFYNNLVRDCGSSASLVPVIELHDTFVDLTQRDEVRNNTFYRNPSPHLLTSGNRTDVQNNLFVDPEQPVLLDSGSVESPLVRYNLFWNAEILLLSARTDTINVRRTVRDTLTLAEQGAVVPAMVTSPPRTLAKVGEGYRYSIEVTGNRPLYRFYPRALPTGAVADSGRISWTPSLADTGSHSVNIEVVDPSGNSGSFYYKLLVYAADRFPDTTAQGLPVYTSFTPDTTGAINRLNALVPSFSTAASAGHNLYTDPKLLDPGASRFELRPGSPALDSGNPVVSLQDPRGGRLSADDGDTCNVGLFGGPASGGPPLPDTSFVQLKITNLPDSVAVEGRPFVYDPVLSPAQQVTLVDVVSGSGAPTMDPYRVFGKEPPITWTPTAADVGTYLLGVTVYTNGGQGVHYFPLRVRPANVPPVFASTPDTTAAEESAYAYAVRTTDGDGDTVRLTLQAGPTGMSLDPATGTLRWTPAQADVGRASVTLAADDGRGGSATQSFTLVVSNVNDPPVIASTPDTLAAEDHLYTYTVAISDPDPGDSLAVSLSTAPVGMSLDSTRTVRWTPTVAQVGAHNVVLTVSDRAGVTAVQRFRIRVSATNDPPVVLTAPDIAAFEDRPYRYAVQATDEEGDALSYSLATGPSGMTVDRLGLVTWTPAAADTGRKAVTIRVADARGAATEQAFVLRVSPVNDAPLITAILPSPEVPVAAVLRQPVLLSVTVTDEDGDSLSYLWRLNGQVMPQAGAPSLVYTPLAAGLDTVRVRVSDRTDTVAASWVVDSRRAPAIVVNQDTVRFGAVALGDTGRAELTVGNQGDADLRITGVTVGDSRFAVENGVLTVPPGQSAAIAVLFAPQTRRSRTTTLTLATNDPLRGEVQVTASGHGTVPTQVDLDLDPAAGNQGVSTGGIGSSEQVEVYLHARRAVDLVACTVVLAYDPALLTCDSLMARTDREPNLLDLGLARGAVSLSLPADTLVQVELAGPESGSGDGLLAVARFAARAGFGPSATTRIRVVQALARSRGIQQPDTLTVEAEVILTGRQTTDADFDDSGEVDFTDFFLFADHFGEVDARFDLDGSGGPIDFADFFVFADHFGELLTVVVPNPSLDEPQAR